MGNRSIPTMPLLTYHFYERPIWGFWGSKILQKWEIPCPGRRWTAVQNLTPLALSSTEKSVTVQTQNDKKKQTKSKRYIHTLPIGMCGWWNYSNMTWKLTKTLSGIELTLTNVEYHIHYDLNRGPTDRSSRLGCEWKKKQYYYTINGWLPT